MPFDPIQIIKESAELPALLDLNKVELNLKYNTIQKTPFQIIVDLKLFQRVMDNLIRNAITTHQQTLGC